MKERAKGARLKGGADIFMLGDVFL